MKLTHNILCLPTPRFDVAELLKEQFGKSDFEIQRTIEATGIRSFHRSKSKKLSTLGLSAALKIRSFLPNVFAGADAVIVVSQTYDLRLPSMSSQLQGVLDLDASTFCIDINDGCSGFIKASRIADLLLRDGRRKVVVVAGDLNSVMTEGADPATGVLFGDGLSFSVFEESNDLSQFAILNDGKNAQRIRCETGTGVMQMNGFEVFRLTRNVIPKLITDYFEKSSTSVSDFHLFGFHQASKLAVTSLTNLLGICNHGFEDFNCGDVGNLGAGSIGAWLALTKNIDDGQARRMLAIGYGAGLSWGLANFSVQLNHNEVIHVED